MIEDKEYDIVNPSKIRALLDSAVIDITYNCSLSCANCNRFCGVFPRVDDMDLECVIQFVDDSIGMKKRWKHILVTGGEPSIHPRLSEIYGHIGRYVSYYESEYGDDELMIMHFTNNYLKESREYLDRLPDYVNAVANSYKKHSNPNFIPVMVASIDLGEYDDKNMTPCSESYYCGMTLNYKGYYPCAESAAIDDIMLNGDIAISSLKDVTFEKMADILHKTCRYCGYYFEPYGHKRYRELAVSETWKCRIEEYKNKK